MCKGSSVDILLTTDGGGSSDSGVCTFWRKKKT